MKNKKWLMIIIPLVFAIVLSPWLVGRAKANERAFTLPWSVIGSGGMGGTADGYTIHSTLGQPVVGGVSGGEYYLTSGFWTEVWQAVTELFNFLPLIMR